MCTSCEALRVDGILHHEISCPDAWKNTVKKCKWCGSEFKPIHSGQVCCDDECEAAYWGYPEPDDPNS